MDLAGALSNPVGPLKTLLEGPHWIRQDSESSDSVRLPATTSQTIRAQHRRRGWVVEAIVRVLGDRQEPMRAKDIHATVEALLGETVRWKSVKAALAANVSGASPRFVRLARGWYRLR